MFGYRMPTRVHIEPGCLDRLPEAARQLGMDRVVLVIDPGLAATDWPGKATTLLDDIALPNTVFDRVEANPRTETVTDLAELIRSEGINGVVALGGGSALDAAKAAAMLANNELKIEQYEGKNRYAEPPLPFVAIPTTCGTGSEVTWVSVLSHSATRSKISVKGESMFPDQALVDADLLTTLPPNLVAWTALDALTHALEATTCTAANPVSDALAEKAIALIFRFLRRAVADVGGDPEAREAIMRASTLAGLAFGNADVAAVHCLSEGLGGMYDHAHGLLNALLLRPVLLYHRPVIEHRLADLARLLPEPYTGREAREGADHFFAQLESLEKDCDLPSLESFAIPREDLPKIAERAVRNGSNRSNPQPMSAGSYLQILEPLIG